MRIITAALAAVGVIISFGLLSDCLLASEGMLVFVTSKRYDGNLGGVEGANKICQKHARAAGLPGKYKAWISTSADQTPAHTFKKSTRSYVLSNNTAIAKNWDDFVSGQHLAAIDHDENGTIVGYSTRIWTGTTPQGKDLGKENCNGWQSNNINDSGWVGIVSRFWTPEWSVEMLTACDEGRNLYCIQQ